MASAQIEMALRPRVDRYKNMVIEDNLTHLGFQLAAITTEPERPSYETFFSIPHQLFEKQELGTFKSYLKMEWRYLAMEHSTISQPRINIQKVFSTIINSDIAIANFNNYYDIELIKEDGEVYVFWKQDNILCRVELKIFMQSIEEAALLLSN